MAKPITTLWGPRWQWQFPELNSNKSKSNYFDTVMQFAIWPGASLIKLINERFKNRELGLYKKTYFEKVKRILCSRHFWPVVNLKSRKIFFTHLLNLEQKARPY